MDIDSSYQFFIASSTSYNIEYKSVKQYKLSLSLWTVSQKYYDVVTEKELSEITHKEGIEVCFHDTFFILSYILSNRHIQHYFVYRLTSLEHFMSIKEYFPYFKHIFIVHPKDEFLSIIPEENIKDILDKISFVGLVTKKESLCKTKQCDRVKKNILISPGYWWDKREVLKFLIHVRKILEWNSYNNKEYNINIFIPHNIIEEGFFESFVNVYSISEEFNQFFIDCDIFIWRWWYNSVTESLTFSKTALLLPEDRVHENQKNRIEFYSIGNFNWSGINLWTWNNIQDTNILKKIILWEKHAYKNLKAPDFFRWGHKIGKLFLDMIKKQTIVFFQDNYIQETQNFVMDELNFLWKTYNVSIFCLHKTNYNPLHVNSHQLFYTPQTEQLYSKNSHNCISSYDKMSKDELKFFLTHMLQYIKHKNVKTIYVPFIWDALKISYLRQSIKELKIVSCARGNDIYGVYNTYWDKSKKVLKLCINHLLVRDSQMQEYCIQEWFEKEKISIIRSWKYLDRYTFNPLLTDNKTLNILIWWRFVEKKGLIQTLLFLEYAIRKNINIWKIYLIWIPNLPKWKYKEGMWLHEMYEINKTFLLEKDQELDVDYKFQLQYSCSVIHKIVSSKYLKDKIIYTWFIYGNEYRDFLSSKINSYMWHFQIARNWDRDWIPNLMIENMLSWNLIFSTLCWGISDILKNEKTWFVLTWNFSKDIEIFYKLRNNSFSMKEILEKAKETIDTEFSIEKQFVRLNKFI